MIVDVQIGLVRTMMRQMLDGTYMMFYDCYNLQIVDGCS